MLTNNTDTTNSAQTMADVALDAQKHGVANCAGLPMRHLVTVDLKKTNNPTELSYIIGYFDYK